MGRNQKKKAKKNRDVEEEDILNLEGEDTVLEEEKNPRIQNKTNRKWPLQLIYLKEVCPEVCLDQNNNNEKLWEKLIANFESVLAFEDIEEDKKKRAALFAVAGQEIRDIFKTLDEEEPPSYDTAKEALNTYFKGKKNLTAERYKFLCMNRRRNA